MTDAEFIKKEKEEAQKELNEKLAKVTELLKACEVFAQLHKINFSFSIDDKGDDITYEGDDNWGTPGYVGGWQSSKCY